MKIVAIILSLLVLQDSFGQDCRTIAENKSAPITRSQDWYGESNQKPGSVESAKMKSNLGKIESWIRTLLKGFTGAKVGYSNEYILDHLYSENLYKATGIKGYYGSTTRFWAYYCTGNTLYTEGEAGSFIYVHVNNVFVSELTDDVGVHTVNGKMAFRVLEKSHSEGRIDFYDRRKRMDFSDSIYTSKRDIIIIRNSDKPVFITITRKEYLQQMLKDVEASRAKQKEMITGIYNNNAKAFEAEMKAYKLAKNYSPENEAKRRKWFEEDQAKVDKSIQKIDSDVDASLEVITQYLQKPAEWLHRSVGSFYTSSYTAKGLIQYFENLDNPRESKEDYTRSEIVSINPDYFNKSLGRDVPQVIMVELVKNGYRYMYRVAEQVKQSGGLAQLYSAVNPGKSAPTETIPPVLTSTYTLNYLPKLTKLTPLIVPAGMKSSATAVVPNYTGAAPAAKFSYEIPALSPKLNQLPQLLTEENYKTYLQQLNTAISNALKPEEKRKAEEYIKNKKLTQSKDIGNTAFAAWLQRAPRASLYLYSKALIANPSDVLAANNFSAFLLMGGFPEKSIPILEYWNKQKPGEATILSNLGNAYYRLGDVDKAMRYLQQCVQRDTLNATANKILCLLYLKKADTKKATEHGTKSITTSHDEQVISVLRQLNNQVKPGEIMSREHKKEFPLLKRTRLPAMPSSLDAMEQFKIELEAEKKSLSMTIESIEAKMPVQSDNAQQKMLMAGITGGIPSIRVKAQQIIMDAMQIYQKEKARESDVFKDQLKTLAAPYNTTVKAINKKYNDQLNKLEGGEAGDEDEIARLEKAKCIEVNVETEKYLSGLAPLVNNYAQRQEFISRKFYRDYANWAPFWMPQAPSSFLSIQRDYLKDISQILSEYKTVSKSQCTFEEEKPPAEKNAVLKQWEDEYCAIFKGKIGWGPVGIAWTCNSWSIEGGEGFVGELEMQYADDGSFEAFTFGLGFGTTLDLGGGKAMSLEAAASVKEFIKVGPNKATGKFEVKDWGGKAEAAVEGAIGPIGNEIKILELTGAVNAGFEAGGVLAPVLNLK